MDEYSAETISYQYPDPDDVAYGARYSLAGEDNDYIPSALNQGLLSSWHKSASNHDNDFYLSQGKWRRHENETAVDQCSELAIDVEYEEFGHNKRRVLHSQPRRPTSLHVDSDEDVELAEGHTDRQQRATGVVNRDNGTTYNRQQHTRRGSGPRGRGAHQGSLGRGAKGIKRGLRNPVEPEPEFKALHSQATMAFIANDFDEAETLTLQALQINPEMYPAHSLLSQIHAARGDADKALVAAWNGAHTRPRDTEMWSRIACMLLARDEEHDISTLRDAIYCYTRIISVNKSNVEARYQRAALNRKLGKLKQVASEYEQLIKYIPHDTTVLRHLAQVSIELNEPERALRHYRATISYLQSLEPTVPTSFTWSDINVLAELHIFSREYHEGLEVAKSLSRWLLGRSSDRCWENFTEDDREWDMDDHPRRTKTLHFVPNKYEVFRYGIGLPLDLRIKLGIFRLRSKEQNLEEAMVYCAIDSTDDMS